MSDDTSQQQDQAGLALDRAHVAAREAKAADLRHALEEARDALGAARPDLAEQLGAALQDMERGALADMETTLEAVRRALKDAG